MVEESKICFKCERPKAPKYYIFPDDEEKEKTFCTCDIRRIRGSGQLY